MNPSTPDGATAAGTAPPVVACGPADVPPKPATGLSHRLGLHRSELRAWAMYDWANSGMVTVVIAAVFPVYFARVVCADLPAEQATVRFALACAAGLAITALVTPVLAAVADRGAARKRLLAAFLAPGVAATAALFFVRRGDVAAATVLFILADVGVSGTFVFYDSLLPHIARRDEIDRVSAAGYALGYFGGGLLLAICLVWMTFPAAFGLLADAAERDADLPARLAFLAAAAWWAIFSLPLFLRVPEPPAAPAPADEPRRSAPAAACADLLRTFRKLRRYRPAVLMLTAYLIYNDGIGTIIKLAAVYGAEIGIDTSFLVAAILLTQFIGVPCAALFGPVADRIGAKGGILLGLTVYLGISTLAFLMTTAAHFFLLAMLVGAVQGGTQALSRSLFAALIPRAESAQFFSFFAVAEKAAGVLGPTLFAAVAAASGSGRYAVPAVAGLFVIGGALLAAVDVRPPADEPASADRPDAVVVGVG